MNTSNRSFPMGVFQSVISLAREVIGLGAKCDAGLRGDASVHSFNCVRSSLTASSDLVPQRHISNRRVFYETLRMFPPVCIAHLMFSDLT